MPSQLTSWSGQDWTLLLRKGVLLLYYFEIGSAYIAQAGLELVT